MRTIALLLIILFSQPLSATASPLGTASTPPQPAQPLSEATPMERLTGWMLGQQRALHRKLANGMQQMRDAPTAANVWALVVVSFLYGVFHAAGPGHGKAVITAYLLTHRQWLRRGIFLSVASSLLQGVTAIVLMFVLLQLAGWLTRDAIGQVTTLEQASFALIGLLGLWLMLRALRGLWRTRKGPRETTGQLAPLRLQPARPAATAQAQLGEIGTLRFQAGPAPQVECCSCGKAHHVDPARAAAADSPWSIAATIFAVGIRPCTGALLVLAVAHLLDLWLIGVLAVLAMSVGTAITVSSLAAIAVGARVLAIRLSGGGYSVGWQRAGLVAGLLGGGVILFLGATLLIGALSAPPPSGLPLYSR